MDPWYDSFAWPYAPFLLAVQLAAFFMRNGRWRWGLSLGCTVAITAMFLYLGVRPTEDDEGVDLGTPIVGLWLSISVVLLLALVVRDLLSAAIRGRFDKKKA